MFLGYSITQSAYFCLDRNTSRIYTSRHVLFHETVFPFSVAGSLTTTPVSSPVEDISVTTSSVTPTQIYRQPQAPPAPPPPAAQTETTAATAPSGAQQTAAPGPPPSPAPTAATTDTSSPAAPQQQPTRMSTRNRKPVQKLNLHATVQHPNDTIPTSVAEALKDPRWRAAMQAEIDSLFRNKTYTLVTPEIASNIVGCRWIFTIKRLPNGAVDRFKARLVAKGYHQRPGIDFHDTFSPVVKPATIRQVLSIAVSRQWPLRQLDVNNAFLQGKLEDDVFMTQPPGFQDPSNPTAVCKLHKAIYGLKQAPRAWYNELKTFLLQSGFTNSLADASLFVYNHSNVLLYMLVYVDDLIITGSNTDHLNRFIQSLSTRFSLKDFGELSYFLGMEVQRNSRGLYLTQTRYIADLLHKTKMSDAKPMPTPMCPSTVLTLQSGDPLPSGTEYRAVIGSLQYLSLTRPDIAYSVNKLSQFMHLPRTEHWTAAKRILRYLAGTIHKGIFFSSNNTPSLHAFTDADWAGNRDDYTSTGAYIVYFGKHPIAWSSKKQTGVARSSTEAEYRSIASTTAEVCWILSLLRELGIKVTTTPTIYSDNKGATYLSANPVFHSRMKHLALDYHFVRQQVQSRTVRVTHVSSHDQLADIMTKPLSRARFNDLAIKIGITSGAPS